MRKIINDAKYAMDYFYGYRIEELKTDDVYYINALVDYIKYLENLKIK
jgi:hypothetical protein